MEKNAFEKLQVQGRRRLSCIAFVQRLVLDSVANFIQFSEIPSFLDYVILCEGEMSDKMYIFASYLPLLLATLNLDQCSFTVHFNLYYFFYVMLE